MLTCCIHCTKVQGLSYEEQTVVCGACRECKKVDLVPHAEKKELFKGKRWKGGRGSRFSEGTLNAIMTLYWQTGITQAELAAMFEVSQPMISKIIKRGKE